MSIDLIIVFSILVKAFLAKAKDEFQVKYDKPSQVGLLMMFIMNEIRF